VSGEVAQERRVRVTKGRETEGIAGGDGSQRVEDERKGRPDGLDRESLELELIDFGLEEMELDTDENGVEHLVVRCPFSDFGRLQTAIEERKLAIVSAEPEYIPNTFAEISDEQVEDVLKLIDRLEGDDDVQKVYHTLP
jgi:transcriptional/translational regulatory protein YebC/TACO1